jgi:lipopolysaccharide exporter
MSEGLGSRIRSGVKVTFAATIISGVIQALSMVVLARLLNPSDYGYYALSLSIASITVSLVINVIERAVVIQSPGETLVGRTIPAAFLTFLVSIVTVCVCAVIARETNWRIRVDILAFICLTQGLASVAIVPRAILRRNLRFRRLAAGDLCATILGNGLTTIAMASLGFGSYALAGGFLVSNLISTATALWAPPPGTFTIDIRGAAKLARTVTAISQIAGLEATHAQVTSITLGAIVGPVALGLFNRVYTLITLPIQLLTSSMGRVMLSGLVAVADDADRFHRSSAMLIRIAAALMTPLALGMVGASKEFTLALLGPKWIAAAPLVPFLAITVWCNMVGSLFGVISEAVQRLKAKFWIQSFSTGALITLVLVGSHWGLLGVVVGAMAASLLFIGLYLTLCCRILSVPISHVLSWLGPGFVTGLSCFAAARALHAYFVGFAPAPLLLLQVLACGVITGICYIILDRQLVREMSRAMLPAKIDSWVQFTLGRRGASA